MYSKHNGLSFLLGKNDCFALKISIVSLAIINSSLIG